MLRGIRAIGKGAGMGALAGGCLATLFLAVGAGGFILALLFNRDVDAPGGQDALQILVYVAALIVGGAGVGVVHTVWKNRIVTAFGMMGAGALVMNAIALSDPSGGYDRTEALWMTGMGCVFGLAGAYGWLRESSRS